MAETLTLGNMSVPFDAEIFGMYVQEEPDLLNEAFIQSGVMVEDSYINELIKNGGDIYTIPFYGLIDYDSAPVNYDGRTDITVDSLSGGSQTGVVFGRAKAWGARQFASDFTAFNPMQAMGSRTGRYWHAYRQKTMLSITDAGLQLSGMSDHVVTMDELTDCALSDSAQMMFGDKKSCIGLAVMHSSVAQFFEDKQRVEYLKYTDPNGITRELNIFEINGIPTVVWDGVGGTAAVPGEPAKGETPAVEAKPAMYNTYLFAKGALRHGSAPVQNPFEVGRDALKNGGEDFIVNRLRETIHPDGFSFKKPTSSYTESPTDAQIANKTNWGMAYSDARAIPIGKLITPGIR